MYTLGLNSAVSEGMHILTFLYYLAVRRRRRGYRHRAAYGLGGGVSSLHPRQGIVHFSNVMELRAAAREMNDYRMITTISRTTGFGQTQSMHYLRYVNYGIIIQECAYMYAEYTPINVV